MKVALVLLSIFVAGQCSPLDGLTLAAKLKPAEKEAHAGGTTSAVAAKDFAQSSSSSSAGTAKRELNETDAKNGTDKHEESKHPGVKVAVLPPTRDTSKTKITRATILQKTDANGQTAISAAEVNSKDGNDKIVQQTTSTGKVALSSSKVNLENKLGKVPVPAPEGTGEASASFVEGTGSKSSGSDMPVTDSVHAEKASPKIKVSHLKASGEPKIDISSPSIHV